MSDKAKLIHDPQRQRRAYDALHQLMTTDLPERFDALADIVDEVVGWCGEDRKIFDTFLDDPDQRAGQ
jgi:hypothetical protein